MLTRLRLKLLVFCVCGGVACGGDAPAAEAPTGGQQSSGAEADESADAAEDEEGLAGPDVTSSSAARDAKRKIMQAKAKEGAPTDADASEEGAE